MIMNPTYNLDCKTWGNAQDIEITGIRCCEICHTIIPEKAIPGHLVQAIGKRDYRKVGQSDKGTLLLVCCGVQAICLRQPGQPGLVEVEKLSSVLEKKYYCLKCLKGVDGKYNDYYQEVQCAICKCHLVDISK